MRRVCGDGSTAVDGYFADSAYWKEVAAVQRPASSVQRPIWAVLGLQDVVRKNKKERLFLSWRIDRMAMFRDELGNCMCCA